VNIPGQETVAGMIGSFDSCPHFDNIDVSDFDPLQKHARAKVEQQLNYEHAISIERQLRQDNGGQTAARRG